MSQIQNRMVKEVASYEKEAKDNEDKVQKMRDEGKDAYDIRKQEEVRLNRCFVLKIQKIQTEELVVVEEHWSTAMYDICRHIFGIMWLANVSEFDAVRAEMRVVGHTPKICAETVLKVLRPALSPILLQRSALRYTCINNVKPCVRHHALYFHVARRSPGST